MACLMILIKCLTHALSSLHCAPGTVIVTEIKGSRLPITTAASANQNVTNKILCEKFQQWPLRVPHKLKHSAQQSKRAAWLILNKTFKVSTDARSLMKRHLAECWIQPPIIVHFTSQHSAPWSSDQKLVRA